jgi:hypothetical protein
MSAMRSNADHAISFDVDGHGARRAFTASLVFRTPQYQPSVTDPIRIDHLGQCGEQAILGVCAGLLDDRILCKNIYAHVAASLSQCSGNECASRRRRKSPE